MPAASSVGAGWALGRGPGGGELAETSGRGRAWEGIMRWYAAETTQRGRRIHTFPSRRERDEWIAGSRAWGPADAGYRRAIRREELTRNEREVLRGERDLTAQTPASVRTTAPEVTP